MFKNKDLKDSQLQIKILKDNYISNIKKLKFEINNLKQKFEKMEKEQQTKELLQNILDYKRKNPKSIMQINCTDLTNHKIVLSADNLETITK